MKSCGLKEGTLFLDLVITFVPNTRLLYPLKTSKSHRVLWCFQGVEKECIGLTHALTNGLTHFVAMLLFILIIFSILQQTQHKTNEIFHRSFPSTDSSLNNIYKEIFNRNFLFCAIKYCRLINDTEKRES